MKLHRHSVVTAPGWSVSCTQGHLPHGQAVLHVSRYFPLPNEFGGIGRHPAGDHDGKIFPNSEAAFAFALEHGYLQPYVQAWCPKCRVLHRGEPYQVAGFTIIPRRGYLATCGCREPRRQSAIGNPRGV